MSSSPPAAAAAAAAAPQPPEIPPWLRGLPRAPEFRPTEAEFADPIAFISRLEREAAASFGICKVIPPLPRPSRRFAFHHLNRSLLSSPDSPPVADSAAAVFTTRHQELGGAGRLQQVWQSGEWYTLEQFEAKSRAFSRAHLPGLQNPYPLTVEALFWKKAATDRPIYVEYANDVPGSCFAPVRPRRRCRTTGKKRKRPDAEAQPPSPPSRLQDDGEKGSGWRLSSSPWNLQAIARAPGSLTRFMPDDVPGVTSPMVYIGMLFSWFAWHVEDHELHSLNFLHAGAPKTWYAVPGNRAADLEEVVRVQGYGGNIDRLASLAMLGEKTTLLSPEVLVASGVPCCRLVQNPGEFVVTFPRAYHVGFSHGFNCGEAANFATPQWLKFAKDAAVRRAAMNYLPMLSHQQLLYLLAVSFISRTPRELLSGIRTSRLRDRRKEERELLVKKVFLQDMVTENKLLCALLEKKSTLNAVLWDPDLLPSPCTVLHSCTSGLRALERKADCAIEGTQCNVKESTSSDVAICLTGTQYESISTDSKSCDATSVSEAEKSDYVDADEDDLPFDLSTDSGSLTCVACGILGYPFMAILQPSRKALEEISPLNKEECSGSSRKLKCSKHPPCSFKDIYSGCQCVASESPSSPVEVPDLGTSKAKQTSFCCQSGVANTDTTRFFKEHTDKGCLMEHELDQSSHQNDDNSYSCSSQNTLDCINGSHSCSKGELMGEANEKELWSRNNPGFVLSEGADRNLNAQVAECCDDGTRWNTSSGFARPRIFCLQHALEIEELLEGKGGAHVLVICHSDYLKVKALAISIAEEIGFQFDCRDVSLENASPSELHLINISIDDEEHEEDGKDWSSLLGLNLKHSVKLRKEAPGNQEQLALSLGGLFSDPLSVSIVPNLKWLCRKARTPYKMVGYASSRSGLDVVTEKVKPIVMKTTVNAVGKVYESRKRRQTVKQCGLQRESSPKESNDTGDTHSLCEKTSDNDGDNLLVIPISIAEYPQMHQVSGGTISVSTSHEVICPLNSQDSPPDTVISVEFHREHHEHSIELSTSATTSVLQSCGSLSEKIADEANINCKNNRENLDSQDDTLEHGDKRSLVQPDSNSKDHQSNERTKLVDKCAIRTVTILEDMQKTTFAATSKMEGNWAKAPTCSFDILLGTDKSVTANEPEALPTSEMQSNHDESLADNISTQHMVASECLVSSNAACSNELQFISHNPESDKLQVIQNSEIQRGHRVNQVEVDGSHPIGENMVIKSNETTNLVHDPPNRVVAISEDIKDTSAAAIPEIDGKSANTSSNSFDILLGVVAEESKVTGEPGTDDVGGALTLMRLARYDDSCVDVSRQPKPAQAAVASADASISDEPQSISCNSVVDKLSVTPNSKILEERLPNTAEVDASSTQSFKLDTKTADNSVNSATTSPVVAKVTGVQGVAQKDGCIDGLNESCVSDIVTRCIGNSARTDIICYVRRKSKRKREVESKSGRSQIVGEGRETEQRMDHSDTCDGFVRGPCESLRPRAGSAIVENRTKNVDNSAVGKCKKMKSGPFKCDIDLCHMTFKTKAELNVHKRNICTVESCGKHFSSHKYLGRHQRVHSDDRPFKCPWEGCHMTFKWLWAQTEHVRVHTGERPYLCMAPGCGQRFRYLSDYSRHRKKFNHNRYHFA